MRGIGLITGFARFAGTREPGLLGSYGVFSGIGLRCTARAILNNRPLGWLSKLWSLSGYPK